MSFSLACARATITKLTVDKKPGEDGGKEVATALKVEVKTSADILAEFHPALRHALFVRDAGVRFRSMREIGWEGTRRNVELAVRPGPDMQPALRLADVTLRDFRLKPIEEGAQQLIAMRFVVDVQDPSAPVSRLLEYLKEESWIDVYGGGELDLAPPSARSDIEGLDVEASPEAAAPSPPAEPTLKQQPTSEISVAAVRRLQPSLKGVKAKLAGYASEVLTAAIAAETAAANCRPMFISMLEGELERRTKEKTQ